ncbi:hypothetical protein K7X08_037554 [Anisodus acutangulus]|uniref:Uncharacterized protein n=1 Tax=Anisodus acutangulus TaxID=402998 RepID=A0A9Q1RPI9_9SOLA|nr:hypothetical protein K7X08_037554 [Anisodus acutangulus]
MGEYEFTSTYAKRNTSSEKQRKGHKSSLRNLKGDKYGDGITSNETPTLQDGFKMTRHHENDRIIRSTQRGPYSAMPKESVQMWARARDLEGAGDGEANSHSNPISRKHDTSPGEGEVSITGNPTSPSNCNELHHMEC